MPEDVATPTEAKPKREFKIPIEHAAPVEAQHGGKQFKIPVEYATMSPEPVKQDTSTEGIKAQAAKAGLTVNLGTATAYTPSWWERTKNTMGEKGAGGAWSDAARIYHTTGDGPAAFAAFANHPLVEFTELFPNNPKSTLGQVSKGAAGAVSGMTSPTQLAMMIAAPASVATKVKSIGEIAHAVGTAMLPSIAQGLYEGGKRIKDARESGETAQENEAWGDVAANVAMIVVPHFGGRVAERMGYSELNTHANEKYKKPFNKLDDTQKEQVLYGAVAEASSKFKKRIEQEIERLMNQKVPGEGGRTRKEVLQQDGRDQQVEAQRTEAERQKSEEEHQQGIKDATEKVRAMAAKSVVNRIIEQKMQAERRKAAQAEMESRVREQHRQEQEAAARKSQYDAERAADPAGGSSPSLESRRGFAIDDDRATARGERGTLMTTERDPAGRYDPEPSDHSVLPKVNDERPLASERVPVERASQIERPVQEFAEEKMGSSFSSLPLDRQKVVARYFERFQPEKWDAFKGTQAYDAYARHANISATAEPVWERYMDRHEGSGEALQPGADEHVGMARLLIGQTDLAATLKAAPRTAKALNEYAEKNFGPSFEALPSEDKAAALGGFLRENPNEAGTFMSPDVAERVKSGQHIDLANMEANLRDRRQIDVLMQHREATRAAMDTEFAGAAIRAERSNHMEAIRDTIRAATTAETAVGERLAAASRGLARLAESINLDNVNGSKDMFHIERLVREIPERDRSAAMREYLAQAQRVRVAAEDQVVQEYRESLVRELRTEAPAPPSTVVRPASGEFVRYGPIFERAAREVVKLEDQRQMLNRQADILSGENATPEAKAEAQEIRDTEKFIHRKEDAVVAAKGLAEGKTVTPVSGKAGAILGKEATVILDSGERVPVHYAVMDADKLIPSHQTFTYAPDERFPQEAQPRDYQRERNLQAGVESRAGALDPGQILTETSLPIDGPPIVRSDGVVIGGNGRTQSMKLAIAREGGRDYANIRREIFDRAAQFGIPQEALLDTANPVLVRVMDVDPTSYDDLVKYGLQFNRDPSMGMSETEQQTAFARLMTPQVTQSLAGVMESLPEGATIRTAMRTRAEDIGKILREGGFVANNKMSEFFAGGDLTERAKGLVENTLAGLTVDHAGVVERASDSVKDRLARVGVEFLRLRTVGEKWQITSPNTEAVELLTRAQDQAAVLNMMQREGRGKDENKSLVERMLHPERFVDVASSFAFYDHAPVNPVVEALAMALETTSPREYAAMIHQYVKDAAQEGGTIFGSRHPAEVFTEKIGSKFGVDVIPEEWGAVGALPEAVKLQIEEAKAPLPMEPAVHAEIVQADIRPDATAVTSVEKGREPSNVSEFRKELASLPGFTDEQAEAFGNIFEHVLPRAISESFENVLKNRMLRFRFGGEEGSKRAVIHLIEDGTKLIQVFKSADPSSVLHEMAHFIRQYLGPADQATLNEFVGAKPGEEWTVAQEEMFAQALERYYFDGGRRKGKLEKAFATIHKAVQAVYDSITGSKLAKATPPVEKMFDNWHDWTRSERKPIAERIDVAALEESVKGGKVTIPKDAKELDATATVAPNGKVHVFMSEKEANDFVDRNSGVIRTYGIYESKDKSTYYVKADAVGKRFYQPGVGSLADLARQAKGIEEQLKRTTDPREEARLRALLNSVENRMGGATLVFGGGGRPVEAQSTVNVSYGLVEMPSVNEPTTPAQAMAVQQVHGGDYGRAERVPDEVPRNEPDATGRVSEQAGRADGQHETAGEPLRRDERVAGKRPVDPMDKVPAASLKAPERQRGTPVVDPAIWKEHAAELGLPDGTPAPTVRLPSDLRDMLIFPGQPEAVEVALSALQQYDGVVVAAPTGAGKSFISLALADQLLGRDGNKVGLIVTRSSNLIHDSDGYIDIGKRMGVEVEGFPKDINEIAGGGVYAATYSKIRGNKDVLSIPWDFVIFDESAEGRNWAGQNGKESAQAKAVVLLGHVAKKAVYVSATPFHTAIEAGYMHKLGMWPEGGFFGWARQFGVTEIGPNSYRGGYAPKKLVKLRQQLVERGQWVSLHRDMDGVTAHVGLVKQTPEVKAGIKAISDTFAMAARIFTQQGKASMAQAAKAQEVIYTKRYIESARLPQAIEAASKAMENGWSPIIFSEYRSGSDGGMAFFDHLPPGMADHLNKMLPPVTNIVDAIREKLGDKVAIFAGDANELRSEEREQFMSGQKQAVYVTYAAGGIGVGFHDKVGDRPRMGIFLGLPYSGIMFEQSLGRTWRYGTKSNVANLFLTSDSLPEMKLLATKILPRMRALNAAVYGEAVEGKLAKQLREASGIHEDMVDYEMGGEDAPDAAQFQTVVDSKDIQVDGPEAVHGLKAKDAKNKGMKYRQSIKKLYQEGKDQIGKDSAEAVAKMLSERNKGLSPQERFALMAARAGIQARAEVAGRDAMETGQPGKPEVERVVKDAQIGLQMAVQEHVAAEAETKVKQGLADRMAGKLPEGGKIALYKRKQEAASVKNFVTDWLRIYHTSGDQAIRKYMADAGMAAEGREIQRKLIERSHLKTQYQGEFMSHVVETINNTPEEMFPQVVRVVEGKETSTDPKVMKSAKELQEFFAYARQRLADAGAKMPVYEEGKKRYIPYSDIQEDANYWPHIYDWHKEIMVNGEVTTLAKIKDMPVGSERREKMIEKYAAKMGVDKMKAAEFFEKNRSDMRLAGNLEKGRRTTMSGYGESARELNIYISQVSEMLANIKTVGQEREKINPWIEDPRMKADVRQVVNGIITADLNPLSMGQDNRTTLRLASQWTVLTKMGLSFLKVGFHAWKTSMVTNTRSLVGGVLSVAAHPIEAKRLAKDAGILNDYVRQQMMMEQGLHAGGWAQKMLTVTGFTPMIWVTRLMSGASGRVYLERYVEPALKKNANDPALRRHLKDLYAFSDEDIDRIAKNGSDANDVKRAMIAAADWTTGSGRPSELPPVMRLHTDDKMATTYNAFVRLTWQLKTFTFKTMNLVNRTVVEGLRDPQWKDKEFKQLGRFMVNAGAAGLGMQLLMIGVKSKTNPAGAEEDKRRLEGALKNPKDLLWLELANVSFAVGLYPAKMVFDTLGTHEPKDARKANARLKYALEDEASGGIIGSDAHAFVKMIIEEAQTLRDDGVHHKKTDEERRKDAAMNFVHSVLPAEKAIESAVKSKPPEKGGFTPTRRGRAARRPARRGR